MPRNTASNLTIEGSSSDTTGTNHFVWTLWNETHTASMALTGSINNTVWRLWNSSCATCTNSTVQLASTSEVVWSNWVHTHDDFRRQVRLSEEGRQRRIQAEAERKEARERAQQLLYENLNEKQRLELADKGHFTLESISKDGRKRTYRIKRGYMRNIHEIEPESGRVLNTICAHPQMRVPDEDAMLIQKLMLESPEGHDDFLRIANISAHH